MRNPSRLPTMLRGLYLSLMLLCCGGAVSAASSAACPVLTLEAATAEAALFAPEGLHRAGVEFGASIDAIAALPERAFSPVRHSVVTLNGNSESWYRICLRRTADAEADWVLTILPPQLDAVGLYVARDGGFELRERNRLTSRDDSEVPYRSAAFSVAPGVGDSSVLYLRLQSHMSTTVDLRLMPRSAHERSASLEYGAFGLYVGMLLLVAAINAMFWYGLRDRLHLTYAAAIAAVACFATLSGGYLWPFLPDLSGDTIRRFENLSYAIASVLMLRFLIDVFRMRLYYPKSRRIMGCLVLAFGLIGGSEVIGLDIGIRAECTLRYATWIGLTLNGFVTLHALLRHRSVRLYAASLLPMQLGMIALLIDRSSLIPVVVPFAEHLPNAGTLVHVVILNALLVRRAMRAEKVRQRSIRRMLQASLEAERQLESRVDERTRQLDQANASLRDEIAERELAEQRLHDALASEREAYRQQRQFVGMVSHELRTPLAVIDAAVQGLADELPDDLGHQSARIGKIRRSVARLSQFIDNCLTEDRLDSSDFAPRMQRIDVARWLRDRYPASQAGRIRACVPDHPVPIVCDQHLFEIALSNLVENALKYSDGASVVEVVLRCADDLACIDVLNHGPPIPREEGERIFDKYYRSARAQQTPGAGLGLFLARSITRLHGGDVQLRPPDPESRTCFRLSLALAPAR